MDMISKLSPEGKDGGRSWKRRGRTFQTEGKGPSQHM